MTDLTDRMREGYVSLVDVMPDGLQGRDAAAWAVGHLYSLGPETEPVTLDFQEDGVIGPLYIVHEANGAIVAYAVLRVYETYVPIGVHKR